VGTAFNSGFTLPIHLYLLFPMILSSKPIQKRETHRFNRNI
jgi:hypothetical protein